MHNLSINFTKENKFEPCFQEMKIFQFSILVCTVQSSTAQSCQEKNKEIRKDNDNLKGIANKVSNQSSSRC